MSSHRLEESESDRHQRGLPLVEAPKQVDIMKFNGGDGEEQNMAGEDKDDDEDDEDEDDEDEDDEDDDFGGGDSNNANEEENEKGRKFGGPKNNHGTVAADESVKFGGPQNERQRAVVSAFQHAWQVLNNSRQKQNCNQHFLWIIQRSYLPLIKMACAFVDTFTYPCSQQNINSLLPVVGMYEMKICLCFQ